MTTDVQSCAKKSRGRPKVFDRDAALDKAMTLFWQHGYEATSLADLVEATGAKAPTLYAEFVNKEGLFRAVLDRYISRFAAKHEAVLFAEGKSVDRALRDYFTAVATCFTSKETPAGCFIINTSAALAASSTDIANTIKSLPCDAGAGANPVSAAAASAGRTARGPRRGAAGAVSQLCPAGDVHQRTGRRRF